MTILLGLIIALPALYFTIAPGLLESAISQKQEDQLSPASAEAQALHTRLRIADLHSDTLLWKRDPLDRADRGHMDLPRLREGNVAVQVFGVTTKSPRGQNYESNTGESDNITALVISQLWPIRTWTSLRERALHQASRLEDAARRAPDQLTMVRTREDLAEALAGRTSGGRVAGLMGLEGSHPLEGDIANLGLLYDAGFRLLGLQHFFDNRLGGSLHGSSKAGLTAFGREVVTKAEAMGFIIDVAHSSPRVVDDVLAMTSRPVVVSHSGVKGACDSPRNLEDEQMRRIAAQGGLIGIGYWDGAVCDVTPAGVARAIRYAVNLVGADHVALGSDYDGATTVTFDTSELVHLTSALLEAGLSEAVIAKVMGENQIALLLEHLPAR
jgi:membrane dipeptidase